PVYRVAGGIECGTEAGALNGTGGGFIQAMAKTVCHPDNLYGARRCHLDLDRDIALQVHLLGLFRIHGLRLVGDLGRSSDSGRTESRCRLCWWRRLGLEMYVDRLVVQVLGVERTIASGGQFDADDLAGAGVFAGKVGARRTTKATDGGGGARTVAGIAGVGPCPGVSEVDGRDRRAGQFIERVIQAAHLDGRRMGVVVLYRCGSNIRGQADRLGSGRRCNRFGRRWGEVYRLGRHLDLNGLYLRQLFRLQFNLRLVKHLGWRRRWRNNPRGRRRRWWRRRLFDRSVRQILGLVDLNHGLNGAADNNDERGDDHVGNDRRRKSTLALFAVVQNAEMGKLYALGGRIIAVQRFRHRGTQSSYKYKQQQGKHG